jgi:hypothetical protein
MVETAILKPLHGLGAALCALALLAEPVVAQAPYPGAAARNPVCIRLEAQLASLDRGNYDPAKAEQIKRLEETSTRQQADLDRVTAQARRVGCEGRGFFALFGGQPAQCGTINNQMQQLRANLDRTMSDLQRLQGNSADREGQRRSMLAALGQNDCGPQYRAYANRSGGGFFESLFGPGPGASVDLPDTGPGGTFRTLCVRTCDGYYFPISYATVPGKFAEDEKVCQAMCPAAEVTLYSHRNPGEDMTQAVSVGGRSYTELPTAFAYRKAFNPTCSCKGVGQTWADALKHLDDQTVEQGDILVNEERARAMSQPQTDAQGRAIRQNAKSNTPAAKSTKEGAKTGAPAAAGTTTPAAIMNAAPAQGTAGTDEKTADGAKRQVRTVGPTFLPAK